MNKVSISAIVNFYAANVVKTIDNDSHYVSRKKRTILARRKQIIDSEPFDTADVRRT